MNLLELKSINTFYGRSHVLFDLSLDVEKGKMVCMIGRNGAGKTTTIKSIMGIVPPKTGRVTFDGQDITGLPPYTIARRGIGYVPEERAIFSNLTLRENLEVAQKDAHPKGWTLEMVYDLFPAFPRLERHRGQNLSGGQQQMLAVGRALMGNPRLLLLDEPTEGLAPLVVAELGNLFLRLKSEMNILLVEQNVKFALKIADRFFILSKGRIQFSGPVEELLQNPDIRDRYLAV
jgi:branched-chain amino acid transport system ATP-binding protein